MFIEQIVLRLVKMSDDIDNIEKKWFEWGWGAVWSKYGKEGGNREVAESLW